jgi:hypothetical protein
MRTHSHLRVPVTTPILVLGDSMADWRGYGLELAYAESPEIGILRQHRISSGLIRTRCCSDLMRAILIGRKLRAK